MQQYLSSWKCNITASRNCGKHFDQIQIVLKIVHTAANLQFDMNKL